MFASLYSRTLEGTLFYTAITNKRTNHWREYWYMGSIVAKSKMQKNSKEDLNATGLYP